MDTLFCGTRTGTLNIAADKENFFVKEQQSACLHSEPDVTVPTFGTFPFAVLSSIHIPANLIPPS